MDEQQLNKNKRSTPGKKEKAIRGGIDIPFFVLTMLLLSFGLIMVFSASYVSAYYEFGDSFHYSRTQLIAAGLGLCAMTGLAMLDYHLLRYLSIPALLGSIGLLALVPFIGYTSGGATRWIIIAGVNFQPSELAKFGVILFFSHCIAVYQSKMNRFSTGILPYLGVLLVISGLLYLEPHYSATIVIIVVGVVLIFVGGAPIGWLALMGGLGAGGLAGLLLFTGYTSDRIQIWKDPASDALGDGYQTLQSLYAIGSGGLLGLGLGQSRQKYLYIPEPHNDYIFSILCEELGFIGAMFVMLLFAAFIWRGFVIAFRAKDKFGSLLVTGIITLVAVQFLINIAVVTNTIPVTGMSLPFFSYGGTALMVLLTEMGIVLSVSRQCVKNDRR